MHEENTSRRRNRLGLTYIIMECGHGADGCVEKMGYSTWKPSLKSGAAMEARVQHLGHAHMSIGMLGQLILAL